MVIGFAVLAACAWCGWASGFHRTTVGAEITWLVTLAAVILVDVALWRGRAGRRPGWRLHPVSEWWPRRDCGGRGPALSGVAPWLVLIAVVGAWEILGIDTGRHEPHLTLSALSLAYRPVRAGALAMWMAVGLWFVVARARVAADSPGDAGSSPWRSAHMAALVLGGAMIRHPATVLALLEGSSRAIGVAFWLGVLVCAGGIELLARRSAGRIATFEELLRVSSRPLAARIVLVLAWAYAGWHLFAH